MRRIITYMLLVIIGFMNMGCQRLPYAEDMPSEQLGTRWVSEEPNIWFEVPTESDGKELYGIVSTENGELEIAVDFGTFVDEIYIMEIERKESDETQSGEAQMETTLGLCILSGACEYSDNECIVKVYKDFDNLFNGEYETIVFTKEMLKEGNE